MISLEDNDAISEANVKQHRPRHDMYLRCTAVIRLAIALNNIFENCRSRRSCLSKRRHTSLCYTYAPSTNTHMTINLWREQRERMLPLPTNHFPSNAFPSESRGIRNREIVLNAADSSAAPCHGMRCHVKRKNRGKREREKREYR